MCATILLLNSYWLLIKWRTINIQSCSWIKYRYLFVPFLFTNLYGPKLEKYEQFVGSEDRTIAEVSILIRIHPETLQFLPVNIFIFILIISPR